ncbi:hypothetical protein ES705_49977 [subsurface metagenome]
MNRKEEIQHELRKLDEQIQEIRGDVPHTSASMDKLSSLCDQVEELSAEMKRIEDKESFSGPSSRNYFESRDHYETKCKIFGEFLQAAAAAGNAEPGHHYGRFQTGIIDKRVLYQGEKRSLGLQESTPSLGGFLAGKQFSTEIVEKVHDAGGLYARARKIPIGPNFNGIKIPYVDETSRANGSRLGGVQ